MISHLLLYSLKSALALTVLYLPYLLMLQKEKYFRLNRAVLLCIIVFSLVFPFFNIPALSIDEVPAVETIHNHMLEVGMPIALAQHDESREEAIRVMSNYSLFDILSVIFFAGMILMIVVRCVQLGILSYALRYRNISVNKQNDGITLCCRKGDFIPFSWMNSIVISEGDLNGEGAREILLHETGHIKAGHSYDMLLLIFCQAIQWYNPFAWHMASSLSDVHEYEADDYVLRQGVELRGYMMLLVKKISEYKGYTFVNSLTKSTLKKRIHMMQPSKGYNWINKAKVLILLPFCLFTLCAFATTKLIDDPFERFIQSMYEDDVTYKSYKVQSAGKVNVNADDVQKGEIENSSNEKPVISDEDKYEDNGHITIFTICEEPPMFDGGKEAMDEFIQSNIVYPKTCLEAGIQGSVEMSLIVYKDGTISDFKEMHSPHPDLTQSAINILNKMPKWIPGRQRGKKVVCRTTITIAYKIDNQ